MSPARRRGASTAICPVRYSIAAPQPHNHLLVVTLFVIRSVKKHARFSLDSDLSGPQTRRSIGQTGDRPPSCSCDFRPMCDPQLRYGRPTPAGSNAMKAALCATR